jgi:hypothetical protein
MQKDGYQVEGNQLSSIQEIQEASSAVDGELYTSIRNVGFEMGNRENSTSLDRSGMYKQFDNYNSNITRNSEIVG